jgi:Tol biopolymer transport system component/DNA-binding winged helix-turn-helix (wHTH) protein
VLFSAIKGCRMPGDQNTQTVIRFGSFEADLQTQELRKRGKRLRLPGQSFRILKMLLERPGELVTREELRAALWPSDTFVDFEHGLHAGVNRLREALGDSADSPRLVETLPRRGYRFIGAVSPAPSVPRPSLDYVSAAQPEPVVETNRPAAARPARLMIGAGVLAAAACTLAVAFIYPRFRPREAPSTFIPVPFTAFPGMEKSPVFSPDGSRIAFAWTGDPASGGGGFDLYAKAIGSETLLRLTHHPSDWIAPAWSPDGTQIAFHRVAGPETGIYVVPALGGAERKLKSTRLAYRPSISWSSDGKWIAFGEPFLDKPEDRIFLLSPSTLEVQQMPHDPQCLQEDTPKFSHSGDEFAYLCARNTNEFELRTASPTGGFLRRVASFSQIPGGFTWSADDRRLIVSEDTYEYDSPFLYEIEVADGSSRRLPFASNASAPDASAHGHKLAYSGYSGNTSIWRKDLLLPDAPPVRLMPSTRPQGEAQFSPDGRHVAFESHRAGDLNIWMGDATGNNLVQLSNVSRYAGIPRWSPDGTKVAFETHQADRYDIYVVDVANRVPRQLVTNVQEIARPGWSHDGKWIYFRSYETVGHKIYRCPASGGNATSLAAGPDATSPQESPDGKTLYFAGSNYNTSLWKVSLEGGLAKPPSVVEGLPPVAMEDLWAVDSGGIYFVPTKTADTLDYYESSTGKIRQVFKAQNSFFGGISISPDGRYLLYSQHDGENSAIIMIVDNFH